MTKRPLAGSERAVLPGARCLGPCDPAERVQVSVILRRQAEDEFRRIIQQIEQGTRSDPPLARDQFAARFGASAQDLAAVRDFAQQHGLQTVREDAARRCVVLSGRVAQFNAAFEVDLKQYAHPRGTYRGREGAIAIPAALQGIVTAVLGLDNRPQARTHFRFRPPIRAAASGATSYLPTRVATLYRFPDGTGAGQCIAMIELGGGYNTSDLHTYFSSLGVAPPEVVAIPVDGGQNQPGGDPGGADGEVMLDIEVAGAIAPDAKIAVYFAGNTDTGFVDAVSRAVHDQVNRPTVISISWGAPESSWTRQSIQAFDAVLQEAAALGVTVCVACGDSGSTDGVGDRTNHVDFPASSPHALACGGTRLAAVGNVIESEVVWNDGLQGGASGGGISTVFPLPVWQQGLKAYSTAGQPIALGRRGVPDVAGNADPATGYSVLIDGTATVMGGTSAVAPLWAGLIARINEGRAAGGAAAGQAAEAAPVGFINPKLYGLPSACNDVTQGNNGAYAATAGWDACTGLGSPNGQKIAAAL
jgi:kumamolisin